MKTKLILILFIGGFSPLSPAGVSGGGSTLGSSVAANRFSSMGSDGKIRFIESGFEMLDRTQSDVVHFIPFLDENRLLGYSFGKDLGSEK